MQESINFRYAGDLSIELEEMEKLIEDTDSIEDSSTRTWQCDTFLTIICC